MRNYKVHGSKYGYYLIRYPKRTNGQMNVRSYYWTGKEWMPRIANAKVYQTQKEAEKDMSLFNPNDE